MSDAAANAAHHAVAGPARRTVVTGGALAAAGLFGAGGTAAAAPATAAGGRAAFGDFTPVPASDEDTVTVPDGFAVDVVAPWGMPLRGTGPQWQADGGNSAAEQARQVGSHHHGVQFFPLGNRRGLLVINHESSDPVLLGGGPDKALAAQGISVVAVRQDRDGGWRAVDSVFNRRITGDTPARISGPAAVPGGTRGVLACSGHGTTPWGTFLAAEENFNACFGTDAPGWRRCEAQVRYQLSAGGFGNPQHRTDARFDLASAEARPDDFGWIVELDPRAARSAPVKRTALGRFAHGSATVTEVAGHAVVYSTDAEDGGYLYRYVSARPWRTMRARGHSPLDDGTLHVARIGPDGTGRWLPLRHGQGPLTRDAGWRDQVDVLTRARLAADALGATPLGRPERVAVSPLDGTVYLALANSTGDASCGKQAAGSGTTAPQHARAADPYGRIIRWRERPDGDASGFRWEKFLAPGTAELPAEGVFAAPKGLWFDAGGTLWISTGVSGALLHGDRAVHRQAGNNALLAADTRTATVRRFLTAPRGAEVTGVTAAPDGRTLFVNIQHPGERTARWGTPDAADPRAVSNWPDREPHGRPRSATVAVHRPH
ncbi:PhoX family protein [Streptomyces albogriseolus]|uniref:PhoX family protein n=1 Tax=Streptomyces albogriseolus TaxID=1887 RepID=UPI003D726E00